MEGSAVTPGMVLFTITNPDHILFEAEINEADIALLSLDQSATVTLDSYPELTFEGSVTKIAKSARKTMTGGTVFPIEITIRAPKEDIAIGMKGDATIRVSTYPNVVTVPYQALFTEGGNEYVYVVENGRLDKTAVETGQRTDTLVEITRGVVDGQEVALAGNTAYTGDLRVRAIPR
jgi:HlyD family secretion protein